VQCAADMNKYVYAAGMDIYLCIHIYSGVCYGVALVSRNEENYWSLLQRALYMR